MVIQPGVSTGKDNNVLQIVNLSDICLQDMKATRDDVDDLKKSLSSLNLMLVKLEQSLPSIDQKNVELEEVARNVKLEQLMDKCNSVRRYVRHEPVNGVCDNLSQLGYNLDSLNQMVSRMKGKIMSLDGKQGLKALADNLFLEDRSVGFDNQPRRLTRTNTIMYSC